MEQQSSQPAKRNYYAAVIGTVVVALCCFTPILVIALAALGLTALTPYLDYVLFPALALLIVLAVVSYARWKKASKAMNKSQAQYRTGDRKGEAPSMSEMICYCFGFSAEDIERDYRENGHSTIMEKIAAEKKMGACQCATKNPSGK